MEFSKIYNRDEFLNFLRRDFLPDDFTSADEPIEFATKTTYSKQATKLGVCKSLDLIVYEIKHSGKDDPRVGLSKEAFRMLSEEWQSRALVLFVPETHVNNYRFSLIEIKLEGDQTSAKVHRKYSNPRRYSYLLGEGIGCYTPNKYLAKGIIANEKDLLDRFSVEVLTKAFYNELSDWYAWAVKVIRFPNDITDKTDDDKLNHECAIRLITRLIFSWFLKQKNLVPEEFFDENYIRENLIVGFNPHAKTDLFWKSEESKYYKAILQNLFFAMLNSPITPEGKDDVMERRFRKDRGDYDNNKLMRYEGLFKNPQLFVDIANRTVPFLNGGLFDCLDDKDNGMYIDGFSDRKVVYDHLVIPDYLFFGEEVGKDIDLSEFYGDAKKKKVSARGVIDILKRYNFTVEENTPFDQEVSLDPELLGKVFENLLASYNPETKTTARKQTGSFYTPREIVQYMVDESLVAHLKRTVGEELEVAYRQLMQYTDEESNLTDEQKEQIMRSLFNCKVLDPACGSGAFPVGMLQQMVHILTQLDPDNTKWREILMQNAIDETSEAYKTSSNDDRKENIADIERSFNEQYNAPDYARKLYLIENVIFGVDIQPIAVQISKLRFFISLVVDQKPNDNPADNFGIRPLPNLEAKFVAANTLVGLNKKDVSLFYTDEIRMKEKELREAKHKIFGAKASKTKRKYKDIVRTLRVEIAQILEQLDAVGNDEAAKLASWDMFDQNASSPFFDPEWMFGVSEGFDIVIGNPPYGAKLDANEKRILRNQYPETQFKIDTYSLFLLAAINNLAQKGICSYIIPNTLLDNYFEESVRRKLLLSQRIYEICDLNDKVFESAVVHSMIFSFINDLSDNYNISINISQTLTGKKTYIPKQFFQEQDKYSFAIRSYSSNGLIKKLEINSIRLEQVLDIRQAIKTGDDKNLITGSKINENYKPILRGKDVFKYSYTIPNLFVFYGKHLACPRQKGIFEQPKILIREAGSKITATFDDSNYYIMSSLYNAICRDDNYDLKYLLALLNSALFQYLMDKQTFEKTQGAFTKAKIYHYYNLPIKILQVSEQLPIINLVDKILEAKKVDPTTNTNTLEAQIDLLVYKLYNLTPEELLTIDPTTLITRIEYEDC